MKEDYSTKTYLNNLSSKSSNKIKKTKFVKTLLNNLYQLKEAILENEETFTEVTKFEMNCEYIRKDIKNFYKDDNNELTEYEDIIKNPKVKKLVQEL